jgi:hypothetical protein
MNPLVTVLALLIAMGLQVALGRIWPEIHGYVDLLLVPVALVGASGSQRSAMVTGCLAGLLHDTWFAVGAFGVTGFRWTLLGWALGSVATRLDLGHGGGRFLVGAGLALTDNLVDPWLLRLLDLPPHSHGFGPLVVQVLLTGLLAATAGSMVDRRKQTGPGMRAEAWRRMS